MPLTSKKTPQSNVNGAAAKIRRMTPFVAISNFLLVPEKWGPLFACIALGKGLSRV